MNIKWESWFEVGNARIDAEHRAFFEIIVSIDHDVRAGVHFTRVLRSLVELAKYTDFHFISEENMMEDHNYPDAAAHRAVHKRISAEMHQYIADIQRGVDRVHELVTFLYDWFTAHTVNEDSALSRYIAK